MIIYDGIWKVAYKPAPCRMTNDVRQSMANTALRSAGFCTAKVRLWCTSASTSANAERSRHALDALVEANVRAQFAPLLESEPVQTVLASGRPLSLHGCVYDLASGHLTTLVEHLSPQEHAP